MIHVEDHVIGTFVPPGYRWGVKGKASFTCTKTRAEANALARWTPGARVVERPRHWEARCVRLKDVLG